MTSSTEKIPKAMTEKYTAIATHADKFCDQFLNNEYRQLVRHAIAALARKRPSPLVRGGENVWAAAVVSALGRINFLDDPSQSPHCKSKAIYEFFGTAESTVLGKAKQVREMLKMGLFSPQWTLPSRLEDNPMTWLLEINGILIDIRDAPIELQRLAWEKGIIPYIPQQRPEQ